LSVNILYHGEVTVMTLAYFI